ncbi:MAG: S-layer homology domain-containing protein [Clostridiales bacterium]|nr:S-layer homology domain-containing protein [Clostridiales bacterium]
MKRRILSLALTLFLIISILPILALPATASESGTDMDALTALGIDTTILPEGYDPFSTDNPYGKNTIELSPVFELYRVGLSSVTGSSASYNTTGAIQYGNNTQAYATVYGNSLTSSLYGNEAYDKTDVSGILGSVENATIASGTTTADGSYTLISTGEVTEQDAIDIDATGYLKDATNASTDLGGSFKYALSSVAAGNFDKNTNGLAAQTVMVYTSDYSTNGGLYLRFGSADSGTYGNSAKELLSTTKQIGNPLLTYDEKAVENFAEAPYQLQNYLQVTTGDWNGDGIDEVAVYIPEKGNSRIVVYALQLTGSDNVQTAYLDASNWSVVWTYYLREGDVVSNMVSLVNGDVNRDGIDDLAATWGYYYGPTQNLGSTAVVMFGEKGTKMLTSSQQFNLTYGSSNIVRASFDFGDMAGSDEDVLILCGQSDADLKAGDTNTRYVGLYSWDGTAFISNVYQNFDLFEKEDDTYTWPAMSAHGDIFYSLPLCTANTGVISQGVSGGGDLLYFDSLIIEYTQEGLKIKEAWDNTSAMQEDTGNCVEYVEYGAVAGDLTGQTGNGALVTMTQTLCTTEQKTAKFTITGSYDAPIYTWNFYFKNWLYKLFNIRTWYLTISGYETVTDNTEVDASYEQLTMGKTHMVVADPAASYNNRISADFSTAICLANTDKDSSYMNYSGKHYYTYTDPEVLAVLASPPYFEDLIDRDDLSGNYSESTTTYSSSTGSGSGYNTAATISLGAYVSFEQDIEVFGVKVASVEAEATFTSNFTFETEQIASLEQTVTYSATSGEDKVAFYSIPMEIYEYESYVADGEGGYKKVLTTVNIPHEAAVRLLSLDEYEAIAKDYSILPAIADNVLTHTLGDPSTYPTDNDVYHVIAKYTGTPSAVGFSSTGGGSGIAQEITMSTESSTAFSASAAVEAKAGAGAGGFKVGVIAGAEAGAGLVTISTNGSAFSGEMQDMPIEAQPFGYNMNWRIFCYRYSDGSISFPVVSYIVSDVQSPASLPSDFEQNTSLTTSDEITLQWSYDKMVAGFRIYRYYEFPDGSGSYEIAFVPFTDAKSFDSGTGTYHFKYIDENLSPYTEYKYQIQTVSATNPKQSIYSEPMSCRTKTQVGYPLLSYSNLNENGQLPIYPDADSTVTVNVTAVENYSGLSYQWQKLVNGIWTELSGKTSASMTISNAGSADNAMYRCRINCIYYDSSTASNYYISAYSDAFTTAYAKRTPAVSTFSATEKISTGTGGETLKGLTTGVELYSAIGGHAAAPTGKVIFTVKGTDYLFSETVKLATSSTTKELGGMQKYYSTASLDISSLPDGVYTVTAYYSGNRIFKDMETETGVLVVVGNGSAYRLSLSASSGGSAVTKFDYGNNIWPSLELISKDPTSGTIQAAPVENTTYKMVDHSGETPVVTGFTAGGSTPDVGSYTLQAYVGSDLVAQQEFSIGKRQITVRAENRTNISASAVEENLPTFICDELTSGELAALNLIYIAINSAGNPVTLNNSTDPGNYTVTATTGPTTPVVLYNNYSVNYISGTYGIIGATYRLNAIAAPYTDPSGERPVGSVGISNAQENYADYASGTAVLLYATPQAGYQVDTWTALFADGRSVSETGVSTFTLTTEAQTVDVTVTFKPATIRLFTVAQPAAGGSITCTDEFFNSGAYVSYGAEYTFSAIPENGYHFSKWQTSSGGATTTPVGTPGPDGSNSLTVTVGAASMTVYAVFERDAYALTLDGDITAYYMHDDDGDLTTAPVKRTIVSDSFVAGDTLIVVEPKTGYQAAEGAYFIINDAETADSSSHTFEITQNTTVSLATVRNNYSVTVTAENGAVAASVDTIPAAADTLTSIPGGSSLTFTAIANRGFVFDHWTLDGADLPDTTKTLTIAALGHDSQVVAVFTPNDAYTAVAIVSDPARGTMKYTLRDIYGVLVGDADTVFPAEGLTVYGGESIVLTVATVSGSMMEQWKVNGVNTFTTQKTYTINNISENIDAVAYLKAASSYLVNFIAMGTTGSTLTGTLEGTEISSETLQFGGSSLVFSATPASGYMLDYWTITNGDLTAPEAAAAVDALNNKIVEPTYSIDPLKQNQTVRAYFTELETKTVTLPDAAGAAMGVSTITFVTPILPTDSGERNVTTDSVRSGGTVRMTFEPGDGYDTSIAHLESVFESAANIDAVISITKDGNVYTVAVTNIKQDMTLSEDQIYKQLYTITVPDGVAASSVTATAGETVTLTVTPDTGYSLATLTLDQGILNEEVTSALNTYTFEMPAGDVVVSVSFTYSGGGGGGSVGGGGSADPEEETVPVPAFGNDTGLNASAILTDGIARLKIDDDIIDDIRFMSGTLSFDLSALDVSGVTIPAGVVEAISGASGVGGLSISLPEADITFDSAAIAAFGSTGTDITLTAVMLDSNLLTAEQKDLVGDKPVLDLTLTADGKPISDFGTGTAEIKVPYMIGIGEDPDSVVVWYLSDSGILEPITGRYDADTGCVVFTTDHFSKYVVGTMPFVDVSREKWYFDSVSFAYANRLFSGIGETVFDPDTSMTRAMLVTVLWRLEGEPTAVNSIFTDVEKDEWYTTAVAWASDHSIVSGYGNGLFGTGDAVTREQMALILKNYAEYKGYDVSASEDLSIFSDSGMISSWAKGAIQWANAEGYITGTGNGKLDPKGIALRCQVAAILQRFIMNHTGQ